MNIKKKKTNSCWLVDLGVVGAKETDVASIISNQSWIHVYEVETKQKANVIHNRVWVGEGLAPVGSALS